MVDGAERVRDPVLAAVANAEDMDLTEPGTTLRAAKRAFVDVRRLGELARFPVRALDRPGDDVLEAAESGPALADRLEGAEPVVGLDRVPAPATSVFAHTASG